MPTRLMPLLAALVAVAMQSTGSAAVIVDQQTSGGSTQKIGSQVFPDQPSFSQYAFDNFSIGTPLKITSFTAFGGAHTGSAASNVAVLAGIYSAADANTAPILSANGTQVGIDLQFNFGGATLPAGSYWINAHIVRPNSGGVWQWALRQPTSGSQAIWHNPGGGFGNGTSPIPLGEILEQADLRFILEAQLVPDLTGDYNFNGVVDAADYVVWRKNDGTQAGYNTWRAHFGQTFGGGMGFGANTIVPEPWTLSLLVVSMSVIVSRRRGREPTSVAPSEGQLS